MWEPSCRSTSSPRFVFTWTPTWASSIARRIPSVGRVTVSLRRSIKGRLHHSVRPSLAPDAWWRSGSSPPPPDRLPRVPRPPADRPPQRASLRVANRTLPPPRDGRSPPVAAPALLSTQQPPPRRPQPEGAPPAARRQARTARDRSGRIRQTRPQLLLQPP